MNLPLGAPMIVTQTSPSGTGDRARASGRRNEQGGVTLVGSANDRAKPPNGMSAAAVEREIGNSRIQTLFLYFN